VTDTISVALMGMLAGEGEAVAHSAARGVDEGRRDAVFLLYLTPGRYAIRERERHDGNTNQ